LGAAPMRLDLTEAIRMIASGELDAQENPLANTVVYGVHKFHHFHTLTSHFYISRPIFVNRTHFDAWPRELQEEMRAAVADAVIFQRGLALEEHETARGAILAQGCEIIEPGPDEHREFVAAVAPMYADACNTYGAHMFDLAGVMP
jgi:TRAP-type C4-dicarboxylate transport system substrate-binding protein